MINEKILLKNMFKVAETRNYAFELLSFVKSNDPTAFKFFPIF